MIFCKKIYQNKEIVSVNSKTPLVEETLLQDTLIEELSCIKELETKCEQLTDMIEKVEKNLSDYYPTLHDKEYDETADAEMHKSIKSLNKTAINLGKACTRTYTISDEFFARWKDYKKSKNKSHILSRVPTNSSIDIAEKKSEHFAKGLSPYKLLLLLFIGSFAGVLVELIWCFIKNGYLESRSGLVYGPFNLLYGAGTVALTLILYRFRNHRTWLSFVGGMLVGSIVEYLCSWGQEMLFGTRSWDYSNMTFNINGRICLMYSFFWGFLGVLWIKYLYPLIAKWILKIPNKAGKIITWVLVVFFAFNSLMTVATIYRWTERDNGVSPSNGFEEFLDEHFPDERMERIFANMEFTE